MSPPNRNQVIQQPKRRPPRPHSSRWSSEPVRRQRAARKPSALAPLGQLVDQCGDGDDEADKQQLERVEQREAAEGGSFGVEQERGQRQHDRNQKQPIPAAAAVGPLHNMSVRPGI
jgi:hypothetical protein